MSAPPARVIIMKKCINCGFEGENHLFASGINKCKKCYNEYMRLYRIRRMEEDPEGVKKKTRESYRRWKERAKENNRREIEALEARLGKIGGT